MLGLVTGWWRIWARDGDEPLPFSAVPSAGMSPCPP